MRTEHREWIARRLVALRHVGIEAEILETVRDAEERAIADARRISELEEQIEDLRLELED